MEKLDQSLIKEVAELRKEGRSKSPERIITAYLPPQDERGVRYKLQGTAQAFLRMNSNSYLSLSHHPALIRAADEATHEFGVGPGAVRFIDGTFHYHAELEAQTARFLNKPAAKIFTSSYMANLGLALTITHKQTYWIGDALNHNSIIRAMRIANVPRANKGIYQHNDLEDLQRCLESAPEDIERVIIIFDGIFSMRGDYTPIAKLLEVANSHQKRFKDGVITVVDDCHGIAGYGETGRGTGEYSGAFPDIIIGTYGKGFGVNGGFIAGSEALIEAVRQKADTYIYSNPLSVADCAAALKSLEITDSQEGRERLTLLRERTRQFREGLASLGLESIPGPHPVVPLLVRDTAKTHRLVQYLYEKGVLVVGLTYPVVPGGDETIRFQINAAHTSADIADVLNYLENFDV